MIFCIYGPSCAGKTTLARRLAEALDIPMRSCGDEVRQRAASLNMLIADLPDKIHREIDNATVGWALRHRHCLVDGRFLDAVFVGHAGSVVMIELVASKASRGIREQNRQKSLNTPQTEHIEQADADDVAFRARMFNLRELLQPNIRVDTSELTVEICAQQIRAYIETWLAQPA
jgi:cytidylate kinase